MVAARIPLLPNPQPISVLPSRARAGRQDLQRSSEGYRFLHAERSFDQACEVDMEEMFASDELEIVGGFLGAGTFDPLHKRL